MADAPQKEAPDTIYAAGQPPQGCPVMYFNGFGIAVGSSDISLSLTVDNKELVEIKGSYTTVKTLAAKLHEAVATLERMTKHVIMTNEEVLRAIKADSEKESA